MITEQTLMQFGLTKDEDNLNLKAVFKNNAILKEIHIDVYPENPLVSSSESFMLLLRTIEKKVIVSNNEDRFILKKKVDKFLTHFMNIPFKEVTECYYKESNKCFEFILNIQNMWYKITIFN